MMKVSAVETEFVQGKTTAIVIPMPGEKNVIIRVRHQVQFVQKDVNIVAVLLAEYAVLVSQDGKEMIAISQFVINLVSMEYVHRLESAPVLRLIMDLSAMNLIL
jgi:hypothetical protein